MALTGSINEMEMEAAGSSDPAVLVFVIAVLEAERDVAIMLVPLQRSLQRLDHAVAELERERPATSR